jgi:two-component system, repressor protein LuxO
MAEEKIFNILLVEDTISLARMYGEGLKHHGYDVTFATTIRETREFLRRGDKYDLILLDLGLPDMNGLEAMAEFEAMGLKVPVIVITGHGSVRTAVEAMSLGARDFLVKPFNMERLIGAVEGELAKDPNETMPEELAGVPPDRTGDSRAFDDRKGGVLSDSPIMLKLYEQIKCAARSQATVFITGESGTGKELCAEAIHNYSDRKNYAFVPINCAAIPRDLMESELFGHVKGAFTGAISNREGAVSMADGGTLFLDEVAEMTPAMQTKLLRFLQNLSFQKVGGGKIEKADVRIICATNRNPLEEVRAGRFREDLFYRLHVLPVYMPPLQDRGEDILHIARSLLRKFAKEEGKAFRDISEEAANILRRYVWPGNVRQLQNVLRHVVVMHEGEAVEADMLPSALLHNTIKEDFLSDRRPSPVSAPEQADRPVFRTLSLHPGDRDFRTLAEIEKEAIEDTIRRCGDNIPKAAAALGVSPSTIYRKKMAWEEDGASARDSMANEVC